MTDVTVGCWEKPVSEFVEDNVSLNSNVEHRQDSCDYIMAKPQYEQEMATVMVPHWDSKSEPNFIEQQSTINDDRSSYVVASPQYEQEIADVKIPQPDTQSNVVKLQSTREGTSGASGYAVGSAQRETANIVTHWDKPESRFIETNSEHYEPFSYVQTTPPQYEQEMATVLIPRWDNKSEPNFINSRPTIPEKNDQPGYVMQSPQYQREVANEISGQYHTSSSEYIVANPKNQQEIGTVMVPRSDCSLESNVYERESPRECNDNSSEYVVAIPQYDQKAVPKSHDNNQSSPYIVARGLNNDTNEKDEDFVDNFHGEDIQNRCFSNNSVDGSSKQTGNKQMYRVTSMI